VSRSVGWYVRRLRRMSPREVALRVGDRTRQVRWSRRHVRPGVAAGPVDGLRAARTFGSLLPPGATDRVPAEERAALVAVADRILAGEWHVLGIRRSDVVDPDWFLDPVTGRRAPDAAYAFSVDHRDEEITGNVKSVWELSRHHHLTVLAAAWWLTHDDRYADVVARQLRSWWSANPFLSGVHWTSGIELGVRLVSWAWIRRLLDGWPGAPELFEENEDALRQIRWHQEYLAAFRSRGSSANNHVIAEACGRLVGACAFPWYAESDRWRAEATEELETELRANTFPSGLNRELATDYHRFVTELGLIALVEADAAGRPLGDSTRLLLASSLDAAAGILDAAGHPPRQGDGDEGRGLVLDDPETDPWAVLLASGAAVLGASPWWPYVHDGVLSVALGALVPSEGVVRGRPESRPSEFVDAGMYLLRTPPNDAPEIWCRVDGGPHGFLSIAAHSHADALSLELRCGGTPLLVDPGTYCYHGEPEWRSYFRSTLAHNTVEVDGQNQSVEGGPFMWSTRVDGVVDRADVGGGVQRWSGHHTGYARLDPALVHAREVVLEPSAARLTVVDALTGSSTHTARLAWHLGPDVTVVLDGDGAELSWTSADGLATARLGLPGELAWTTHRGESQPVLGWYSPGFGEREPSTTLVGTGTWTGRLTLTTVLDLAVGDDGARTSVADATARATTDLR
jgi:hypothetical protein